MSTAIGCVVDSQFDKATVAFATLDIPITIGTFIYTLDQQGKSKILMRIVNIRRISTTVAMTKYALSNTCPPASKSTRGVLIATARIVGIIQDGSLRNILVPPPIKNHVYMVDDDLFREILKTGEETIELGRIFIGYKRDSKTGSIEVMHAPLVVDFTQFSNTNVIMLGLEGLGLYDVMESLLEQISQKENTNVIIIDAKGEIKRRLENRLSDRLVIVDADEAMRLLNNGFGFLYMDVDEIISVLGPKIGYNNVNVLQDILGAIKEYPLSIEKIVNIAESQKVSSGFIEMLKRIWENTAGKFLEPNSVVIIDLRGAKLRNQIQLVHVFFKQLYDEMSRRIRKGESVRRFIVIDPLELYLPANEFISDDLTLACREQIINVMLKNRLFKLSLIGITETPSMINPLALYLAKSVIVGKVIDRREIEAISKYFGLSKRVIMSINENQFLLKGNLSPLKDEVLFILGERSV